MKWNVRQATNCDASTISVLYQNYLASYEHQSERQEVISFLEKMLIQSWVLFFVATEHASDKIIGFAGCTLTYSAVSQSGAINLNDMFVDSAMRRRGVATALCDAIEDYARCHRLSRIFVKTDPRAEGAITMYKKCGYDPKPYLPFTKEVFYG